MREHFKAIPAVYILFRRGDEVLLLKRANTGYRDGYYSTPAGHVDGHESLINAAIREAKEEVGVTLTKSDLRLVHVQHRVAKDGPDRPYDERINFGFQIDNFQGEVTNMEPDKCSELRWCDVHDLPDNMVPEFYPMIQAVIKGEMYSDFDFEDSLDRLDESDPY